MRRLVLTTLLMAAPGGAMAAEYNLACSKAGDERRIEIVSPGSVGKNCDVRYSSNDGATVSVPYHADNSPDFCRTKAAELAETLKASGYACTPIETVQTAAAPAAVAPQPAAPAEVAAEPAAPVADLAALPEAAPSPAPIEPAPAAAPIEMAVSAAPTKILNQPAEQAPGDARIADAGASLEDKMNVILAEPPVNEAAPAKPAAPEAVRGPAQLTPQLAEAPQTTRPAAPVGRLVGATPDPRPQPAASVTPASATQDAPQPAATPAEKAPTADVEPAPAPAVPVAASPPSEVKGSKSAARRKPADVVRATLQAQASAWNEGNLDAFMATYWKSDDLVFVSGDNVTKGWNATMKRYRERYADESGLGQLGFDKMDVELVTDDVAVVTGRFNHTKGAEASSGMFSLVLRQTNGVWRIVHDHTVVDAKAPE